MKTVRLKTTFFSEETVPDDWELHNAQFHFEENSCLHNRLATELARQEKLPGICDFCNHATCEVVGIDMPPLHPEDE